MKDLNINFHQIKMNDDWKEFLKDEFFKPYFLELKRKYLEAKKENKIIYPSSNLTFNAFNLTPLHTLKVILIGQDPYHQPNQAMGLSFSVPNGVKIPPSLINIYKELNNDLGISIPKSGDLSFWAKQGVLLLNSVLSVEAGKAASHSHWGWQEFSDAVISNLNNKKENLIFLLWGNFAKNKKRLIDTQKHFVLEAAHPSPLAGNRFLGCKHFSKVNEILKSLNKTPIDWDLNSQD